MKPDSKGKKRQVETKQNDSSDEDESSSSSSDVDAKYFEDSDEDLNEKNINVEFEAFPPAEADFHGMKNLLLKMFLMLHVDVSELTDLIISQSNVGSTIKIVDDEDDETFGIVSILSIQKFQNKACIKELKKELLNKLKENKHDEDYKKFECLLNTKNIGLLLNERFINIPAQLAIPFHKSLREEVEEAKSEDSSFKFDHLLIISKTLKPTTNPLNNNQAGSSKKKKKKKQIHGKAEEEIEYTNFEEEIFYKASQISFNYEVTKVTGLAAGGDWDFTDQQMKTYRTVMLVPTTKWTDIIDEMEDMVK